MQHVMSVLKTKAYKIITKFACTFPCLTDYFLIFYIVLVLHKRKALSLGHILPAYLGKDFADIEHALEIYEHFITSREEVRAEFDI